MEHKTIDHEISELMKAATAKSKENQYSEAVDILKIALSKIAKSTLLYSPSDYTKIIPYFQKAERYQEAEQFCLDQLIPDTISAVKRGMSQRCKEVQALHSLQYKAAIYDKLILIAKRESRPLEEKKYSTQKLEIEKAINEARPIAEKRERDKEIKEMESVFGADTALWPEAIRKKLAI